MLERSDSERAREIVRDRKSLYWGFGLLAISIVLSYGPTMVMSLLMQGRSLLPPVNDPSLKWTGTDAEYIAFVIQWIVGALLWFSSMLFFVRIRLEENRIPKRIGIFLTIVLLVYGLFNMGDQATRIDPQW